jgi:glutathione S-transferase
MTAAPLKIWGRANSINVQKVLWCASELNVKFERIDAGQKFGVVDTPEFKALNPNGLVPTISDNGFVLWESHAIVRFLSRKYGAGSLFPDDLQACAEADKWMEFAHTTIWTNLRPVFWGLVRTAPEKRNVEEIELSRQKLAANLAIVDAHLASHDFAAGSTFTMGDIPLGVAAFRWFSMPLERPPLPHLEAWFKRICERPAFKQFCMLPLT